MTNWTVSFFNEVAKNNLANWPNYLKAKLIRFIELIEIHGPMYFGMPHIKGLGQGLFEIRVKSQEGIGRVFFCMIMGREIIILHSFIKKTQKTPLRELSIARERIKEALKNEQKIESTII